MRAEPAFRVLYAPADIADSACLRSDSALNSSSSCQASARNAIWLGYMQVPDRELVRNPEEKPLKGLYLAVPSTTQAIVTDDTSTPRGDRHDLLARFDCHA